jgi:hypothetical protein
VARIAKSSDKSRVDQNRGRTRVSIDNTGSTEVIFRENLGSTRIIR